MSNSKVKSLTFIWPINSKEMTHSRFSSIERLTSPRFSDDKGHICCYLNFTYFNNQDGNDRKLEVFATKCKGVGTIMGEIEIKLTFQSCHERNFKYNFSITVNSMVRICSSDVSKIISKFQETTDSTTKIKCVINYYEVCDAVSSSFTIEGFQNMYLNEKYSDLTLRINDENYPAHKIVLSARSKVFEVMFNHDMKENQLNRVEIEDINEQVFLEALRFMYTGNVAILDELAYELLPIADRYDITELKISCENTLCRKLSAETAVKILMLADSYNKSWLKTATIEFITKYSETIEVMSSDDWEDLISRPELMKELLVSLSCRNQKPISYPSGNQNESFGKMYLSEKHSDLTLCINGKKAYPAHRIVLSGHSKVFESMFDDNIQEKPLDRVEIDTVNEKVFLEALRFMYTGEIQNFDALVYDLLPIADRYDIMELKTSCGKKLQGKLSVETAVKILMLADSCNENSLKTAATEFIAKHSDIINVISSEEWKELMSRVDLMKCLLIACACESKRSS